MEHKYTKDNTNKELLAAFISREISDGELVTVGAALPVPRAGVLLAHLHHGPNMTVIYSRTRTNLFHVPELESFEFLADWRGSRWAESFCVHDEAYDSKHFAPDLFFIGGIQIDQYGNSNLMGLGQDHKRLKLRGPGGVGTCSATAMIKRYYLYTPNHDKQIFGKKCDFISAIGWGDGGADARSKLRLPGGGPKYCITPLCIMDFEEQTKRMRLKSLHPGVSLEEVIENTGFELIIPDNVPTTDPPTEEEIRILNQESYFSRILRKVQKDSKKMKI